MKTAGFSDRELSTAASLVNDAMLEAAEASAVPHAYSESFSQNMQPLFQRARKDEARRSARRRLIAALLALVVGASVFFAFNDTARAAVQKWIRTAWESRFVYQTSSDPMAPSAVDCTPHWLPEGFEPAAQFSGPNIYSATYENSEAIAAIDIDITSSGAASVLEFDLSDGVYAQKRVMIGDCPGDLFLSRDPEITSAVVWFDETTGVSCSVMGCLSEDELLRIAENLEVIYE